MLFQRNVGMIDRLLRTGIGAAMIYAGFFGQQLVADDIARLALGVMGIFMVLIAILGICPMYALIGFSTAPARK